MSASATLSLGYVGIYVTPWVANFIEQPAGAVVAVAASPSGKSMGDGWGVIAVGGLLFAAAAGIVAWTLHAPVVDHWLAVHTGTVNEPGPY
jgi:hypothetical protein